jgi:hypothetical protein
MKSFYITCLILGIAINLRAQQAAPQPSIPPMPSGPLLKRAPDYSTWSVTCQGHPVEGKEPAKVATTGDEKPNKEAKEPVTMASTVVKTGSTIFELNTDTTGKRTEIWHVNGIMVMKVPGAAEPIVCPDSTQAYIYAVNFAVSDFAGLDWISAKTYTGMAKYQGRDCIEFKGDVSPLTPRAHEEEMFAIREAKTWGLPVPQEIRVPATAYIDLETRLPLYVQFGNEKRFYGYGDPPSTPLALPPELKNSVKAYSENIQRLSAPASRPY